MKKLNIPFIKNRGSECGQACVAMMIKYFKPNFEPDFDEFNKIIHHKNGMATFPPQNAILLDHYGIKTMSYSSDSIMTSSEDFDQFRRWFGKDFDYEMKSVDLPSFDWMVKEFRSKKLFIQKETTFEELIDLFEQGFLVCIPINWNILNDKSGSYDGHFVILTEVNNNKILIHDPNTGPFVEYDSDLLKKSWELPPVADDFFVAFGLK
ncbi:MAG: hypothetical protein UR39_C0016G0007 [Candidatus Woesebacteria bacterium GW2011_GWA1_33_30]|uniref:Peptidase C39 domain-containing protein n=1 Tax=Candidatus Woesebacteria bacterium GW2011_GWA2_33_28 TaxID=1618561 RepID=A0A0F9ZV60_9BACT|nr:MAG: hypothetical protein UR39_C0016G0007 [Candidatus Woesebacteria bacterium GW2011_GWA1_33_30]KKP48099.1 MAG: hypothetical protein UR38_C0002G0202 [Candidatus Woesebacteria bacterium GW2011_GWA2_33_28]KKP50185.1 MAG: hypothetical protein UR40_C0002G0202 [Microgenomates group bacterium GW2011_GWC1_33_32]KKP51955.1 MAG: hypothetical protein UR44_C0006G0201 [Candidatus Woesebacteria bacterium GW2011_GWB1_33_38]KKP58258.1 MAG: hypothetical protein UR48_C0006G0007 [Microgenomates group bacteriu